MPSDYLSSRQSARRSDSYFLYKVGRYESALVPKLSMQKETSVKHTGSAAAKWSLQNPCVPQLLVLSVGLHSMKQLRELLLIPLTPSPQEGLLVHRTIFNWEESNLVPRVPRLSGQRLDYQIPVPQGLSRRTAAGQGV